MKEVITVAIAGYKRLTERGKLAIRVYTLASLVFTLLDGVAILLLANAFTRNSGSKSPDYIINQEWVMILIALGLFALRSVISIFISWQGIAVFASQESFIADRNYKLFQGLQWSERSTKELSDALFAIDRGPSALVSGVVLKVCNLCVELVTGIIVILVTVFINPVVALTVFLYLMFIGILQHRTFSVMSAKNGEDLVLHAGRTADLIADGFSFSQLLSVMPSKSYATALAVERSLLSIARARADFLRSTPRAFIELALVIGVMMVGVISNQVLGAGAILSSMVVFAAVGFRLLPIANQVQVLVFSLLIELPSAKKGIIDLLDVKGSEISVESAKRDASDGSKYAVRLNNVGFRFPTSATDAISGVNFDIPKGAFFAIVGPTGSGKSTIANLCIGLLKPTVGEVIINEAETIVTGYVPQEVKIFNGTISQNIALEWFDDHIDTESLERATQATFLGQLISEGEEGTRTDNGRGLSGGQKQLIGLARAIYRGANFLVLDEATSDLDNETESRVMDVIQKIRGNATMLVIAHRLATIRTADKIIYMKDGVVYGIGTFDELRRSVSDFENQVNLGILD